jgi:hypothetical protein
MAEPTKELPPSKISKIDMIYAQMAEPTKELPPSKISKIDMIYAQMAEPTKELPPSKISKIDMIYAQMAELVDALVSGTSIRKYVQVRVLFWAQKVLLAVHFFLVYLCAF